MKKANLLFALAAGTMMFTACSSENDFPEVNGGSEVQEIVLQVSSTGGGLQSRGGRPLYGSEAKQTIENIKVIVVDGQNNIKYACKLTGWNTTNAKVESGNTTADEEKTVEVKSYDTGGHGRECTITIPDTEHLSPGSYKVYAFGYHDSSEYNNLENIANLSKGGTFTPNTVLEYTNTESNVAEEIFAGYLDITVSNKGGVSATVVLNRQVAGTFGYFQKIPYNEGARYLRLYAVNQNSSLVLGNFNSFDLTGNGTGNDGKINYVINGATPKDGAIANKGHLIYSIDLNKWFSKIEEKNGLISDDNWSKPTGYTDVDFLKGSVFGGTFVIPFAKNINAEGCTFTLYLEKEDGSTIETWNVKLPLGDKQLSAHNLYTWNNEFVSANNTDNQNCYNVVRNHLYGIGLKSHDKNPDPEPGPDPDPDDPEPLNKNQELILHVNDNWELIHKMELD